jgi:hypothetical protein
MHEAAGVRGDERVGALGPRELLVGHRNGDLRLPDRERPAEAAAEVRPREGNEARARPLEQPAGRVGDAQLAQQMAGVVVGERAAVVRPIERHVVRVEEGRELVHLVRLDPEELRQTMGDHRSARAGGDDDRKRVVEAPGDRSRDPPRGAAVPGVEGRLPAADLAIGDHDVEPGVAQEPLGIRDRVGDDEIAEARREELHAARHRRDATAPTDGPRT